MNRGRSSMIKFGAFATVMALLFAFLIMIFGEYRTGPSNTYSAIFTDASALKSGDAVMVAGIRVGSVDKVSLRPDNTAQVSFGTDRDLVLTIGTKAAVRYLNLVGDRYLELLDGPASTQLLPAGSQIPVERTTGALDLDTLLGGLKPVIRGLNPQDVNALTSSLLEIFQGQGDSMQSLISHTSSFSNDVADNNATIEQLIDNLDAVLSTLNNEGSEFSTTVDRFQRLVTELAKDRDPVGAAIDALDSGTATIAELLGNIRSPLARNVDQLNRLAPLLDADKGLINTSLHKAPTNFRKLDRVGAYGSFLNYYLCGIAVRVTDLQGRTAQFPWVKQENGRCAEPNA
jgi:phospholipid/cholesterol/gamma-HCH transport system substrate-binding protein